MKSSKEYVGEATSPASPDAGKLNVFVPYVWLPVVHPGFSWDNLKRLPPGTSTIPRNGGRFFWEQFHELAKLEIEGAYVAMFDEVDEGTAIFKVSNTPPSPGRFLTYDGLPSDW